MIHAATFLILLALLLLFGGPFLVKKFLRGHFVGTDAYVILTIDGKTVSYKNPKGRLGHEDKPLDMVLNEILHSDQYEAHYNVCWFDCGALFCCDHPKHRTREQAQQCPTAKIPGRFIGQVLEEC